MVAVQSAPPPTLVPYDAGPTRERVRSVLALLLMGLVFSEVLGIGWMAAYAVVHPNSEFGLDKISGLIKDLATLVLTPTIALAGAVMGFYYGSKDR
jgi:hypothetical protein